LAGKRVAIEKGGWFLPISFYEALLGALPAVEDATTGIVEVLRRVKSPLEIAALEQSARHADAGIAAGLAALREGVTENDIVAGMMRAAIVAGAEYMGMEPLVSSGPRSGVPHATWRRRRLEQGDTLFLEMSGCYNRYHAGLARCATEACPRVGAGGAARARLRARHDQARRHLRRGALGGAARHRCRRHDGPLPQAHRVLPRHNGSHYLFRGTKRTGNS
jgi:Xaa-Pro dipeptidase